LSVVSSGVATFPKYSETGVWTVWHVELYDVVGNNSFIGPDQLAAMGFPTQVTVTGLGDTTPPVLHGLSFSPTTVNNLDQPANVTVGFDVTDDISGISTILIWFMSPSGQQLVFANPTSPPWSGGALSVVSSGVATFPKYSETGVWTVWHVELYDVAGNNSFIGPGQLAAMGLPTQITVNGIGDTTPPVLHALSFPAAVFNTSIGPANINVNFSVTDDISGISTILIWFMSPSGQQLVFANPTSPPWSGGALSVVSSGVATFPQFSETGVWTVWHVELYDVAGNSSFIGPGQLAAMGLPTQIIVTGAAPSLCDIKQDGNVSISDVQLMINEAMGLAPAVNDINGDGVATVADVQIVINSVLSLGCLTSNDATAASARHYFPSKVVTDGPASPVTEDGRTMHSAASSGMSVDVVGRPYNVADIGTLGSSPTTAYEINDLSQAVRRFSRGGSFSSEVDLPWSEGAVGCLQALRGARVRPYGVNDSGQPAGSMLLDGNFGVHAFRCGGTVLIDLGTLGGTSSVALGINSAGQIVGSSQTKGDRSRHAFVYNGGLMMDLGTLGGTDSQANGIDSLGLIVGWAKTASGEQHAFLWSTGRMLDLNSFTTLEPNAVLVEATSINDVGQVVANGSNGRVYLISLPVQIR
jgi:probable HAF family extracellular repeat protein